MGFLRLLSFLVEFVLLLAIVGLSMTTAITIGLLKSDYNGGCLLYPTLVNDDFIKLNDVSNCNFIIGMHSIAAVIAVLLGVFRLVEFVKNKRLIESTLFPISVSVILVIVAVLVMATACVITVGFNEVCGDLLSLDSTGYLKCVNFQLWGKIGQFNWSHFHDYLVVAEAASWISFGLWLAVAAMMFVCNTCCKGKV